MELERKAIICHGLPLFVKERYVDTTDNFTCYICSKCGLILSMKIETDICICVECNKLPENQEIVHAIKIELPFAFKLLTQELIASNILPKIKNKKSFSYE